MARRAAATQPVLLVAALVPALLWLLAMLCLAALNGMLPSALEVPLLLLWGEQDPWIVSATGDRLEALASSLGKAVERVSGDAGHCPQDEAPEAVNKGLLDFAAELGV